VRSRKRQNVMRPGNKDSAIKSGRASGIAIEPSTRGDSVATRGSIVIRTCGLDRSDARGERRSRRGAVSPHNERGTQAMTEHAFGVVGKHLLNLGNGIATLGQHHVERSFASLQIVCFDQDGCGYCSGNRGSPWRSLRV
jgi:hypothetical protein